MRAYNSTLTVRIHHESLQKRFVVIKQPKNYADSAAHCKSVGGSLALPESLEENQQIMQEIGNTGKIFSHFLHSFLTVE